MDEDFRVFIVERYKALCGKMDELREIGRQEEADKLYETEVKKLLEIILSWEAK